MHVPKVPTQSFFRIRSSTLSTAFFRPPLPWGLGSICHIVGLGPVEGVALGVSDMECARRDVDRLCLRRRRAVDCISGCFFTDGVSRLANRVSLVMNGLLAIQDSLVGERVGVGCRV